MKTIRVVIAALAVMVLMAGCSININTSPSSGTAAGSGGGSAIDWSKLTTSADKAIIQLELSGKSSDAVDATLTVRDGHSAVIAADLDEGSCGVAFSRNGEDLDSDEVYTGTSVSESGLSAGTYDIDFFADGATGTVYVLSYPAGALDFEGASPDSLYETVRSYISENM